MENNDENERKMKESFFKFLDEAMPVYFSRFSNNNSANQPIPTMVPVEENIENIVEEFKEQNILDDTFSSIIKEENVVPNINTFKKFNIKADGKCADNSIRVAILKSYNKEEMRKFTSEVIRSDLVNYVKTNTDLLKDLVEGRKISENINAYSNLILRGGGNDSYLTDKEIEIIAKLYGLNIIILTTHLDIDVPKRFFYGDKKQKMVVFFYNNGMNNLHYDVLHLKKNYAYVEDFLSEKCSIEENCEIEDYSIDLFIEQNPGKSLVNPSDVLIYDDDDINFESLEEIYEREVKIDKKGNLNNNQNDTDFEQVNPLLNPGRMSLGEMARETRIQNAVKDPTIDKLYNHHGFNTKGSIQDLEKMKNDLNTSVASNAGLYDEKNFANPKKAPDKRDSGRHPPSTGLKNPRTLAGSSGPPDPNDPDDPDDRKGKPNDGRIKIPKEIKKELEEFDAANPSVNVLKMIEIGKYFVDKITSGISFKNDNESKGLVIRKEFRPEEHGLMLTTTSGKKLWMIYISYWLDKIKDFRANPANECLDFKLVSCLSEDARQELVNQNLSRIANNTWRHKTPCPQVAADVLMLSDEELTEALLFAASPNNLNEAMYILKTVKIFLSDNDLSKELIGKEISINRFPEYVAVVTNYMFRYLSLYKKMAAHAKDISYVPNAWSTGQGIQDGVKLMGAINLMMGKLGKLNPLMANIYNHLDPRIQTTLKQGSLELFVKFMHRRLIEISSLFTDALDIIRMGRFDKDNNTNQGVISILRREDLIASSNEEFNESGYDDLYITDNRGETNTKLYDPPKRPDPLKRAEARARTDKKNLPCISLSRCPDPSKCQYSHDPKVYEKFMKEISDYSNSLKERNTKPALRLVEQAVDALKETGNNELEGVNSEALLQFMAIARQLSPAHIETEVNDPNNEVDEDDDEGRPN